MKLFIPLATGQFIPKQVYESIAHQNIDINIIPCATEGVIYPNSRNLGRPELAKDKLKCELISRNLAINIYNKYYNDKYIAMQDRDVIHLFPDNFERCINYLDNNLDCDAVALPWKEYEVKEHIRTLCFIIRGEIFKNYTFRNDYRNCTCRCMQDDLNNYKFLPSNIRLIKEII